MKVEDVPQDLKYYKNSVVRDVDYAVDNNGHYQTVISGGWTPKNDALEVTLEEIDNDAREVLEKVRNGKTSLLEYYAVKNLMPIGLLSSYTGIPKRVIKKHLIPENFSKLSMDQLTVYAEALRITVNQLTSLPE